MGETKKTPDLRRHPSRHLRAEALRLEFKSATAPNKRFGKARGDPSPHEYTDGILKCGHSQPLGKGRRKGRGTRKTRENEKTRRAELEQQPQGNSECAICAELKFFQLPLEE